MWWSNQYFHLTPASHIPLVCSVEAIPSCIYMCMSRIRFILLVFSDVPLHALVRAGTKALLSLHRIFHTKQISFQPHNFQLCLLSECDGSRVGSRHTRQWCETLRCSKIQLGQPWCLSQALLSSKGRDVLQKIVTQKVQRWQHGPDGL